MACHHASRSWLDVDSVVNALLNDFERANLLLRLRVQGETIALVMLSGVQYLNGQLFDISSITAAGHRVVCSLTSSQASVCLLIQ